MKTHGAGRILAFGRPDALTYGALNWQDADSNIHAAASFPVGPEFLDVAQSALARPACNAEPYTISMAAAGRAQGGIGAVSG